MTTSSVICDLTTQFGPWALSPIGRVAEALVYYDRIYLDTTDRDGFARLVCWFNRSGCLSDLIELFASGSLIAYHHDHLVGSIKRGELLGGLGHIAPARDERMPAWEYVPHDLSWLVQAPAINESVGRGRRWKDLRNAVLRNGITVTIGDSAATYLRDAEADFFDSHRCTIFANNWIADAYRLRGLRHPPSIEISVEPAGGNNYQVSMNLSDASKMTLARHGVPLPDLAALLADVGYTSRYVLACEHVRCDLYPAPHRLNRCCDKLIACADASTTKSGILTHLELEAQLPDIAGMVDSFEIDAEFVMRARQRAHRFRRWLHGGGLSASVASREYANEADTELLGLPVSRRVVSAIRAAGVVTVGALVTDAIKSPIAGSIAAVAASGLGRRVAEAIGLGWRPKSFGDWVGHQRTRAFHQSSDSTNVIDDSRGG